VILGHAHPEVDAAARDGQEVGTVFAMSTEREATVAELVAEMVEAAELVRFSNSGTEAVMAALRIARGATGRDGYVIFEGSYHGLFDAVMWQADVENLEDPSLEAELLPFGKGARPARQPLALPTTTPPARRMLRREYDKTRRS
jgi:glutamate-1-semialdehyde 2,1-aminomutase